jgi:hypothetical protein
VDDNEFDSSPCVSGYAGVNVAIISMAVKSRITSTKCHISNIA